MTIELPNPSIYPMINNILKNRQENHVGFDDKGIQARTLKSINVLQGPNVLIRRVCALRELQPEAKRLMAAQRSRSEAYALMRSNGWSGN